MSGWRENRAHPNPNFKGKQIKLGPMDNRKFNIKMFLKPLTGRAENTIEIELVVWSYVQCISNLHDGVRQLITKIS